MISQRVEFPPEVANEKLFIINAQVRAVSVGALIRPLVTDRLAYERQLPSYGPSVWGDASSDGPGFSLVLYWKVPTSVHEVCELGRWRLGAIQVADTFSPFRI
jgi:hypothetical protein